MKIAIVGLGRMGGNMARRLLRGGHAVVAFDREPALVAELARDGATPATSLDDVCGKLEPRRAVWVMVPAGAPTEETIAALGGLLEPGDTVIDGGNSHFRDSVRRGAALASRAIRFLDVGTSGGVWGLDNGYCLMVGGDREAYDDVRPALSTLAPADGLGYFGRAGAGHFAKMVHNGIEYAMMQAYAEGFDLLRAADYGYDLAELTRVWNHGSVVRSWLLELAERAFAEDPGLTSLAPYVEDSGEGRWAVEEAVARAVPAPTIAASLFARFTSRQERSFAMRVVAALRRQFGGHRVKRA